MNEPKTSIETRIRYVFKDEVKVPASAGRPKTFTGDGWIDGTPDGAANYPWLMDVAIVWVEERVVYEPDDWGVAPIEIKTPIDYRKLLIKYINHVGVTEGTDFLSAHYKNAYIDFDDEVFRFSDKEWDELMAVRDANPEEVEDDSRTRDQPVDREAQ